MPRKLIAVVTCNALSYPAHDQGGHKDGEGRSDTVRKTWYLDWITRYADQVDLKFFFGRSDRTPLEHEIMLDCGDDYYSLPHKVRRICEYAVKAGYDETTKVDDDVALRIGRLLANPSGVDYRGFEIESDIKYASGTCYQLSRRAMEIVARAPIPEDEWREDRHVGRTLLDNGIKVSHEERFLCCNCAACIVKYKDSISIHTTHPSQIYELMEASYV